MKHFNIISGIQNISKIILCVSMLSFNLKARGTEHFSYELTGASTFSSNYGNYTVIAEGLGSITINNINEGPTDIILSGSSINENVPPNITVGTLSSSDPDAGDTFTYTLVSGTGSSDNAFFNISGNSLVITNSPDYEAKSSYSVRVRSTDQGSLYYEKAFTITILNVNEPPVITAPASISITEDVASALTGISFSDIDAGNYSVLVTLSSATGGTLSSTSSGGVTVGGSGTSAITLGGSIANINAFIAASNVTYTTVLNSITSVTLNISCSDQANTGSGGIMVTSTSTNLIVTAVNDPPSVNGGLDGTINEGSAFSQSGSFTDPDAGDTHTVRVTNWGDGSSMEFLTVDAATKTFSYSHVYPMDGTYTITIRVTDNNGDIGTDNVVVRVNNVTPVVSAGPDGMVNEGTAFSQSGSFTDPGTEDYEVKVNYGDGSSVQIITFNPVAKTFNLNHVYSDNGVYTITVTVTDDDGAIGTDQVTVVVPNVSPSVNAGADGNVNEGSVFSQSGSFSDPGAADTHTAKVDYGDGSSLQILTFDQVARTFTLNHLYPNIGVYTITVTFTDDDGGTGTDQVAVTVLNVAPTDIALSANSINENVSANSTIGTLSTTDPGTGSTFTYTLVVGTGSTDNASFNINGSSLRITNSPDYEAKSSYSVRVRSTDLGSLYYEKTFTITISDLNEAPTNITLSASSVNENVAANSIVGTLSSADPDAGNTFTYTLVPGTGSTDNASFNISGNSLRITNSPDYETKNSYSVRVRTTDQGSLTMEKAFTITIIDVIEYVAPVVTTQVVTNISGTGATGNGTISSLGVPNPTQYGVVWSIATNPTIALPTKTELGAIAVTGAFTSSITGLSDNTKYYVRAYATNSAGTSYGNEVTFTTLLTDVANLALTTVRIYPNPATDEVYISSGNDSDGGFYKLLSISGRTIKNGVIVNGETRIALEGYSSGIYILQIQIGIKKASFKIVKK